MNSLDLPGCCKARLIRGFPQGDGDDACQVTRDSDSQFYLPEYHYKLALVPVSVIENYISKISELYARAGYGAVTFTLSNKQTKAIKAAKNLGISHSPWMERRTSPYEKNPVKIRIYWKPLAPVRKELDNKLKSELI